jgi:hypothetical protein
MIIARCMESKTRLIELDPEKQTQKESPEVVRKTDTWFHQVSVLF